MESDSSLKLQQFLLDFSSEHNTFEKAEKLLSFTTEFVKPSLPQDLHSEFICKAVSQIPSIFESILKLVNEIGNKEEFVVDIEKILKASGLCLETLLPCFSCNRSSEEMLTLHVVTLNTLCIAYQHCKDSELIYENQIENVADKLAVFFNQIQDLERAMLVALDKLLVLNPNSMVQDIVEMLGKLGQLFSEIDAMASFKYWRSYIKIIVKHKEILKQNFMVDSDLIFLTSKASSFFEDYLLMADQDIIEQEEVSLKVCSLQINVITRILEQYYDCISDSIPHLANFIAQIYDILIFCSSKKPAETTILFHIQNVIPKVPKQLTSLLKQSQSFLKYVFRNQEGLDGNDCNLASCMVELACLPNFEASTEDFNFLKFLQMFFGTLQNCKPAELVKLVSKKIPDSAFGELAIPIQQEDGFTSIYNYTCSEISTCWKTYPNSTLENGVASLLQILSTSSDIVSLLLSDTWIYRLRYTSIDFLCSYCLKVSEVYSSMSTSVKVDNFLKRILKFLSSEKTGQILSEIDCLRGLTSRKYPSSHRFQIPQLLSSTDKTAFNELVQSIELELQEESSISFESFSRKAFCCLILSSYFVEVLPSYEICKLIEFAECMFKSEVYEIQIAVLTFLKACSKKCIPESDPYGKDRWKALASLFLKGLLSSNYIVRCEAYRTFSNLAHKSPRSKIIQQTLMLAPHLKPSVTSNFNLVPVCGLLSEEIRLKLFCERISLKRQANYAVSESNAYFELLTLKDE
ncbi:uncharacterized protein C1orf112 homolog [Uloborus diversus]|uniref:uncharacterized protein C1orf112 homolog n=1 Tax=Uloborus diversus TaxID=327109 RepID=UPI0024097331|nr:uncharacterized protein C1orf112 homolog [Uloborus diversus]